MTISRLLVESRQASKQPITVTEPSSRPDDKQYWKLLYGGGKREQGFWPTAFVGRSRIIWLGTYKQWVRCSKGRLSASIRFQRAGISRLAYLIAMCNT